MVDRETRDFNRRPGVGVDALGGPVVDPTKNVLDLVKAESKYQDSMREALKDQLTAGHQDLKEQLRVTHEFMSAFQNAQVAAESRRIDQLAQTRQEFQNTIRDMLAESVRTTSTLVSTQLVQIQATFDTRVSKLEAGAFTQAGKQSVADPALADAMTRVMSTLNTYKSETDQLIARMTASQIEQTAKLTAQIQGMGSAAQTQLGTRMGQGQVIAWIIGAAMLMAAIATPLIAFLALRHP